MSKMLKEIWERIVSVFAIRPRQKFYTAYTRRMQLVQKFRKLQEAGVRDVRDRLNMETK